MGKTKAGYMEAGRRKATCLVSTGAACPSWEHAGLRCRASGLRRSGFGPLGA